jgi:dTDP-4-dehydrorhamnose reductase
MNKSILVIGKNGQLGQSLFKVIEDNSLKSKPDNWNFKFISRDELDLSNLKSIKEFFYNQKFSVIINFAAYTSVDKAESDIDLANQINHLAVAELAEVAKNQEIPLIHISTDYVFHGQEFKTYIESDNTDPVNVYGLTKLKGEQSLIASGCTGAIIRTSWLYSEYGKNFVKTILGLGKKLDNINVVNDQVGSPTYAINLARLILTILNKQQTINILNSQLNIYHFSDEGICSWYDFAKTIFKLSDIKCEVNPVKTKDYPSKAKRPNYNVMSKKKIKQHFPDFAIQHWKDSLINCLTEIKKNRDLLA